MIFSVIVGKAGIVQKQKIGKKIISKKAGKPLHDLRKTSYSVSPKLSIIYGMIEGEIDTIFYDFIME
jgi:hypothetical protein